MARLVALALVGQAAVVSRLAHGRVEADGLRAVGDLLVPFAHEPVGSTPIAIRLGKLGVEPYRLAVFGDGGVEVATCR